MEFRQLGSSDLRVSPVGFGCWPLAGISSLGVNDADSVATIQAALDQGINFFDTAYSYGFDGEADRLLASALKTHRQSVVIASKVGQYFDGERQRQVDGRPEILWRHAREGLERLRIDAFDLLYLHGPDPDVPLAESAGALREIVDQGMARYVGVCNVSLSELREFHEVCPVVAVQLPFNMLQQQQVVAVKQFCKQANISIVAYWVLMKGLLAGKMDRDHHFDPRDKRLTYAIYQGESWQRAQDFLDHLRWLAKEVGCSVAQLVVAWTIRCAGVDVALCGAKRPYQIKETAAAAAMSLSEKTRQSMIQLVAETPPIG